MTRVNVPFLAFNRGLISPKALARVDLDRTKLSAEVMTNWLSATQASMSLRPGTKWKGSSLNDTGAYYIEFVAATDDVALGELTPGKMRVWLGEDAHDLALLGRPKVDTTVSLSDTGWEDASTGGVPGGGGAGGGGTLTDLIPQMTGPTTNGVTITASSQISAGTAGWKAADNSTSTWWQDSGEIPLIVNDTGALPSWLNVDFGAGNAKALGSYSLRAGHVSGMQDNMPRRWRLLGSNFDTGTYATDTGKWVLEDTQGSETGWAVSEKRTYRIEDTGTAGPWRHWRLFVVQLNGDYELQLAELEMFADTGGSFSDTGPAAQSADQVLFEAGSLTLNAGSIGARAIARKQVVVSDTGTEHALDIVVERGPVTLRVGSTDGDDDYIRETTLGTGHHNLAFTPQGNFYIRLQSDAIVNRVVSALGIADSGTVELATPWQAEDLDNVRYDQSADVVYVDCSGVKPMKIERRGTGRSWSVVEYAPGDGPFLPAASSTAKLSIADRYGNTTISSDVPLFQTGHVGSLIRMFHQGQSGKWLLGQHGAATDPIEVTGISDTGTPTASSERRITFAVSGTWAGTVTIERSIDGEDIGFKTVPRQFLGATSDTGARDGVDTGTVTFTIDDEDDNLRVWYRARISAYTSGVASVVATYGGGGVTGLARITGYVSNTEVQAEVLSRFSDTGATDNWQFGYWSQARGFPTAVALHGGRLAHAMGGSIFLSVADDYESFDEAVTGDAGPIIRSLGSGPVDRIRYLISLLRLVIGTAGAELAVRSDSLDARLTPTNTDAVTFSTQGSANLRALRMDNRAIFVQRSGQRLFMIGPGQQATFGEYEGFDLTLLVPELLAAGVVSIAIQRQPDTRIHCVLADGRVAILTYEPNEEVLAWALWQTDGAVERVAVLPGLGEDAVYYHVRRTVNGATRRFLEKLAKESECRGDTGLSWLADCAVSYTDTGRTTLLDGVAPHLAGAAVVAWGSLDTGSTPHVDLSPDVAGVQTTYAVDTGGDVSFSGLSEGVHHAVVGLPYEATWESSKLAYGAEAGTALAQMKRVAQLALVLYRTHNNGLFFGSDTGRLSPLPRMADGRPVDPDHIFDTLDKVAVPFPGTHDADVRLILRAKAPRPVTVLAAIPAVQTNERV